MARVSRPVAFLLSIIVSSITSMPSDEKLPLNKTEDMKSKTYVQDDTIGKVETPEHDHDNKTKKLKYCYSSSNMSVVMREIMGDSQHNVHTIPSFEKGKPLEVKLALTVLVFRDIKEVDMTYTVDFFLRTKWTDKRLKNSLGCVLTMTLGKKHPAEIIWVPDTMIENAVTSHLHEVLTNNHKVDISSNGDVFWSTRVTVKAMCNMDLVKYPGDKQTCSLVLLSYAYPNELVRYVWDKSNPVGVMDKTLSQFDVTSFYKKSYNVVYVAGEYSILESGFVFERRLGFYLIQVYIPCIFLVVLAGLSFWVDPKAIPARVALSLTTLLTIATIWSAANANMPPVSYVKAIDIYFLTSFGFVLATLLEYIVVLNYKILKQTLKEKLHFREPKKKEMNSNNEREPYCKHDNVVKRRSLSATLKDSEETMNELRVLYNGSLELTPNKDDNEKNTSTDQENEKKVVSKIDKITRFLYPLAYTAFNVVYWYKLRDT